MGALLGAEAVSRNKLTNRQLAIYPVSALLAKVSASFQIMKRQPESAAMYGASQGTSIFFRQVPRIRDMASH